MHPGICFDGSLGGQAGPLEGTTIFADRGKSVGANLFHSFDRFSVNQGETITFQVPEKTLNILARVSGGQHSQINGTITTDIPTDTNRATSLYLINPAGIIFGEGASINVAGSFTATTADYVDMGDGSGVESRFWASIDKTSTLVSEPPVRFGFLPPGPDSGPPGEFDGKVKISKVKSSSQPLVDDLDPDTFDLQPRSGFRVAAGDIVVGGATTIGTDESGVQFVALDFGEALLGEKRFELSHDAAGGAITLEDGTLIRSMVGGSLSFVTPGSITVSDSGLMVEIPKGAGAAGAQTRVQGGLGQEGSEAGLLLQAGGDLTIKGSSDVTVNAFENDSRGSIVLSAGADLKLEGNPDDTTGVAMNAGGDDSSGSIVLSSGRDLKLVANARVVESLNGSGSTGTVALQSGRDIALTGLSAVSHINESAGDAPSFPVQGCTLAAGSLENGIAASAGRGLLISEFAAISTEASNSGRGGDIDISARSLVISGPELATAAERGLTTGLETVTQSAAKGGDIRVRVDGSIEIRQAGGIYASTNEDGSSGSICVEADELKIVGARNYDRSQWLVDTPKNFFITGISNKSSLKATGGVGSITVEVAGDIVLSRGGLIDATTFSDSNSGDVSVTAKAILADRDGSDYFTGIGAGTEASSDLDPDNGGSGANVIVNAEVIRLFGGAQIAASSRSGGDAGNVRVSTNDLCASGSGSETPFLFTGESGVVASTLGGATGDAGSVFINALKGGPLPTGGVPQIHLSNGAEIGARVDGTGTGGSVDIQLGKGRVILDTGAGISARTGENGGTAGDVLVQARDITVKSGASINSRSGSTGAQAGNAGSVTLRPGFLTVDGGRLEVSAVNGNGGDLVIEGGQLLDFRNGAELVAEVSDDPGSGGNVRINGAYQVLFENSNVTAKAKKGAGGNIEIKPLVLFKEFTPFDASSETGVDGVVEVDSQVTLSGAESELEASPLDATDSLQAECTDRLATKAGSFIRAGRGGTSRMPGGYLPSLRLYGKRPD